MCTTVCPTVCTTWQYPMLCTPRPCVLTLEPPSLGVFKKLPSKIERKHSEDRGRRRRRQGRQKLAGMRRRRVRVEKEEEDYGEEGEEKGWEEEK